MSALTPDDEQKLDALVRQELESPPTIGVVGMSGVGKSSTINRLFRTKLDISHTTACTKEFWEVRTQLTATSGPLSGKRVDLQVFDAPGLGEDFRQDPYYLEKYNEFLPQCDVILWLMSARNRAVALDQKYLDVLRSFSERMVFGVGQVDLVEPMDWNPALPIPSKSQESNIKEIVADRAERIKAVTNHDVPIVPFSAKHGYNLETLFLKIVSASTPKRKWVFHSIKGFSFEDFLPSNIRKLTTRGR